MENAFRDAVADVGEVPAAIIGGGTSEQLELLRDPQTGRLPADAFRRLRSGGGPGRRPGSRNKRNSDLAKLVCQKAGDPILFLAGVYATELDQLVEMLMIAEGVPEREDRLIQLCDTVEKMTRKAMIEGWSEARLKVLESCLKSVENAAGSLKAKPGDIALKALGHQIQAAREVSPYVHSKKPTEITATHKVDGVIFMPGPQSGPADPIDAVMRRTVEAIQGGQIDPAQIQDLRFNPETEAFEILDDQGDEA